MTVTVSIPSITGREQLLARAVAAYRAQEGCLVDVFTWMDMPACGYAWEMALQHGAGEYVHFGADDVELAPGAFMAAIRTIEQGKHPAPLVLNPDGSVQSCGEAWGHIVPDGTETSFSRGPMIARAWSEIVGPIPVEMHYYTDNLVSERLRRAGIPSVVCHGYSYVHHMSPIGRRNDTWARDRQIYVDLMGADPA